MKPELSLPRWTLALYCLATGFSVAAVVYHQSMTQLIAATFQMPVDTLWRLSVATQFGYGVGLILGLPLGDMLPPRRLIPVSIISLGAVLLLVSWAPSPVLMTILFCLTGVLSIGGQLLIAHCAKTVAPEQRPVVVGHLLSSLFAGLLLARVLSGWGAEHLGWRAVYQLVGILTLLLGIALLRNIRQNAINTQLHYLPMLRQQGQLWLNQPELRRLALVAACFFAALNGIWANLASLAHATLHWSSGQTGLLAFTAIVALGAPAMVRWLQNHWHWSGVIVLLGTGVVAVSLAGCWLGSQLPMIIAFLIMSDVSVRSIQVITQGRVLSLDPFAASRLNSLFMTVFFLGAALGSWLGGIAVHHFGWTGMYLFPLVCTLFGLALLGWRNKELCFVRV
ncbi:MFS transporter [Verminephrobacter eiseniae]|nr:MFS transporter [Verminephrobacter eiseniae]MCW5282977.1 MFS transporter [Verminephrobacter eiseniae]MCW5303292.1 MFS transporter [Verminephrobacter eiseniae]MCW8178121.1 MFS transporter [Verminephrobacter eiseniae]MCW8188685.1 MFS transporter [Verminephrobacter eiseniae]